MKKSIIAMLLIAGAVSTRQAVAQDGIGLKDLAPVIIDISDIDKLRILNPIEMKAEQLDKVLILYKKTRDDYLKKVADIAGPALKKFANDAKELRKRLIGGGTVPDSFVKSVVKSQADFVEKRRALDQTALRNMSEGLRDIFDKDQMTTVYKVTRNLLKKDNEPAPKYTDDQVFSMFVKGTFFEYDHIQVLLEDMVKAHKP